MDAEHAGGMSFHVSKPCPLPGLGSSDARDPERSRVENLPQRFDLVELTAEARIVSIELMAVAIQEGLVASRSRDVEDPEAERGPGGAFETTMPRRSDSRYR